MGFAFGEVRGQEVGYGVEDVCNHPGCNKEIDRGLAHACGEEHGPSTDLDFCTGYFCSSHLFACEDGRFRCAECSENKNKGD